VPLLQLVPLPALRFQQSCLAPACFPLLAPTTQQLQLSVVRVAPEALRRWGLDCGFFQPALPPCPTPLLPLDQQGRMRESPATTQKSIVSIQNTSSQVLDYSTRGAHLLRRSLDHLQLLGDSFACHIARPPWRRRETSLQASMWIFDKGDVGQPRSAEPGPQLEPLLQRLPILLVSRIFYGDSCRMDLPGPTTSVGTRTDYSVGPWDYPACATRHLKAWSTRTTQE
jgi:hypothetical protein